MSRLRFYLLFAVLYSCSSIGYSDAPPSPVIIDLSYPPQTLDKVSEKTGPLASAEPNETSAKMAEPKPLKPVVPAAKTEPPNPSPSLISSPSSEPSPSTDPTQSTEPTLTPAPTTAATPAPTTATTPEPTPAPGPLPPPDQVRWSYTDKKTNITCIIVQFAAQLNVTYTKAVENATSLAHVILNVPANGSSVIDGSCEGDQWLTASWTVAGTNSTNNITLVYQKNDTTKDYGLKSLNIILSPEQFVNISPKVAVELYHGAEWRTPLATSYRCAAATRLNLTSESTSAGALTLARLQEEAFRTAPGAGFSAARECGGGDVPDAVPIAVGCALGGLVVVVLVAYLVARRRSAARGYLSM